MINNRYKILSHEALKGIACGIMLLDHVGILLQSHWMRMIGRMAFPIFCFLITEGAFYTKNPKRYALRLLAFALLSEIPYDLFVGTGWYNQNVLFTLLLGFCAIQCANMTENKLLKGLTVLAFAAVADFVGSDYGACGILLIVAFSLSRLSTALSYWLPGIFAFGLERYPTAVLSLVPIACYNGRKLWSPKWSQWMFYLFYPIHMLLLFFIRKVLS